MFRQTITKLLILFLVLVVVALGLPCLTLAQSETAYDLVQAVNALRAVHGLEPYQIDPWLMEYAQEHSEYQAAIQSGTHRHSDGSLPQDIGIQENVASGDYGVVTVAVVVNEIWVDWGHRHILIGYTTGDIGAGIALSETGQVYYTVNIRPGEESSTITPESGTSAPFIPLETSTPSLDGAIFHIVRYGETLWGIAESYGVTVDDIRQLNAIADDSTLIYVGQILLIRPTHTGTPPSPDGKSPTSTRSHNDRVSLYTDTMTPPEATISPPSLTAVPTSTPTDSSSNARCMTPAVVLTLGIIAPFSTAVFRLIKSHPQKKK